MNNLNTFLRRQSRKLLDSSIQQLKAGITNRLCHKYIPLYGEEKAGHLSSAIVNSCMLEEPGDMESKIFYQNHTELINDELLKLPEDDTIAEALSYLFAAETLYTHPASKISSSKHSQELAEQAAKINIQIPPINQICGSADINECVIEIMKFAAAFYLDSNEESDITD